MLPLDAPMRPTAPTEQRLSPVPPLLPGSSGGRGAFGAVMGALRSEVLDFIAHGDGDAPSTARAAPASTLSVEGHVARAGVHPFASGVQSEFIASIAPPAEEAAEQLGVAPELVVAHAALESGWGQRPLRQPDGRSTHNLFGVKAGAGWQGDVVQATTTEVLGGVETKKVEPFRAYADSASAFRDYARMLLDNPRYRDALGAGSDARAFAKGLAQGGYATDPTSADKLERVARSIRWPE